MNKRKEREIEAKVRNAIAKFRSPLPVADLNPESTDHLGGPDGLKASILYGDQIVRVCAVLGVDSKPYHKSVCLFATCESDKVVRLTGTACIYHAIYTDRDSFLSTPVDLIESLMKSALRALCNELDRRSKKEVP